MAIAKNTDIVFVDGVNQNSNYDKLKLARIDESPLNVQVHIVEANPDMPSRGVGEPGVPPFPPALCNAIYAATGKRIRNLPIGNQLAT
jgi:isoquinoline 1-oxidoreductase beta subunit